MKYTRELLLHILHEGGAELLGEYKKFSQRTRVGFRCKCGKEGSKRFEMLALYKYPNCNECSLRIKEEKRQNTCIIKYGVINTTQLKDVKEKN